MAHLPPHPPGYSTTYKVVSEAGGYAAPTKAPEFKATKGIALLSVPNNAIIPSRLGQTTNKNNGKECGEFVNDVCQSSIMGNTLASKIAAAPNTTGKKGDAIVWLPDPNNAAFKAYGHTGIILGETPSDWIVKSANLYGDGRITTNYVPKSVALGYRTTNLV